MAPLFRKGYISTDPINNYYFGDEFRAAVYSELQFALPEMLHGFLIDANVFGGSSGSLVFLIPDRLRNNKLYFSTTTIIYVLGITTYSYFDIGVYQKGDLSKDTSLHRLNLGGVISSEIIKETIDLFNQ